MRSILFIVAVLLSPAAAATWYAYGTHEPDTAYDLEYGDPWTTPPGRATNRVYFNGFTQQASGLNPNVGMLQTSFETTTLEYHVIMVGRWIDCNGDGYVGSAETAQREYPIELLLDQTLCPQGGWSGPGSFRGWVTEFIPLAPVAGMDGRVIIDSEVKVWADHGLPNAAPIARASCAATLPNEGARSVGALLAHADCLADVASYDNADQIVQLAGYDGIGSLPVPSKIDLPHNESRLPRSIFLSAGDAEDEDSFVSVHDCADPNVIRPTDTPIWNGVETYAYVPNDLAVVPANPEGSPAGTYAYASEIAGFGSGAGDGPCDGNSEDPTFYDALEGSSDDSAEGIRRSADILFEFHDQPRGSGAAFALLRGSDTGAAPDMGIGALGAACEYARCKPTGWYAEPRIRAPATLTATRLDLDDSLVPTGLGVGRVTTYYGYIGADTAARGFRWPYFVGTYGDNPWPECHAVGWECSTANWYPALDAHDPLRETLPMVGDPYNVLDIDCVDGGISDTGMGLGVANYGDVPCPEPPYDPLLSQLL